VGKVRLVLMDHDAPPTALNLLSQHTYRKKWRLFNFGHIAALLRFPAKLCDSPQHLFIWRVAPVSTRIPLSRGCPRSLVRRGGGTGESTRVGCPTFARILWLRWDSSIYLKPFRVLYSPFPTVPIEAGRRLAGRRKPRPPRRRTRKSTTLQPIRPPVNPPIPPTPSFH
jgi:hypothetical protein